MGSKSIRGLMGTFLSIAAAAAIAGAPLAHAVVKPAIAPADTVVVNSGITVNALDPSDDVHQLPPNASVDPTNHQDSSKHPNTTAQFVISLSGVTSKNFTAPITAHWKTQAGSYSGFTNETGTVSFPNRYAQQYQFVKIPVQFNSTLYSQGTGAYETFNLVITSATNAAIGRGTATEYVVNGTHGPVVP